MTALPLVAIAVLAADPATADPGAFPVPAEQGMKLDSKATRFHVPFGFARVERFYRDQFGGQKDVAFSKSDAGDEPELTIRPLKKGNRRWTKAQVRADAAGCVITVTRVVELGPVNVAGELPPVQFVMARSSHVKEQLDSIDHVER